MRGRPQITFPQRPVASYVSSGAYSKILIGPENGLDKYVYHLFEPIIVVVHFSTFENQ